VPIPETMSPAPGAPVPARRAPLGRRLAALAVSVAVVAGATVLPSPPGVDAQRRTELTDAEKREILDDTLERAPRAPASPDDPFHVVHVHEQERDEAAVDRLNAAQFLEAANVQAFNAGLAQKTAQLVFDEAERRRTEAQRELAVERDRLSDLTVRAFVSGGTVGVEEYRAYVSGDTTDIEGGRQLMFSHVLARQERVTEQASRALAKAREAYDDARSVLTLTTAFATDRAQNAERMGLVAFTAASRHETAIAEVAAAKDRLRAAGRRGFALVPETTPLIGIPRLSAEDLAGWFRRSAYRPRIPTPVEDFARWFIEEGQAEGIRGDVAFAQAILETGGFANDDSVYANNYSGIGHCDTCASGWRFPSPQMGVRAQIQLLKSYALASPRYVNPKVDARLRGPAGCCPTWIDLTTVWATDPTYGPKVMLIYSDIVAYALGRRAAGQGLDDPRPPIPVG
jgi:hypothetical protein